MHIATRLAARCALWWNTPPYSPLRWRARKREAARRAEIYERFSCAIESASKAVAEYRRQVDAAADRAERLISEMRKMGGNAAP